MKSRKNIAYHQNKNKNKITCKKNRHLWSGGAHVKYPDSLSFLKSDTVKIQRCDFYHSGEVVSKNVLSNNEADYRKDIKEGLEEYDARKVPRILLFFGVHGNYFSNIEYFLVPSHIIICSLTPPNNYGLIESFIPKNAFRNTNLFEDMFNLKSYLQKEDFKFEKHKKDFGAINTDYFKFASWYYPNQICPNAQLNINPEDKENWVKQYNYEVCKKSETDSQASISNRMISLIIGAKPKLEITLREICEFCHSNNNYIIFINNCNEIFLTIDPDYHNIQKQVLDFHYLNNKVSNEIGKELYDKKPLPRKPYFYTSILDTLSSINFLRSKSKEKLTSEIGEEINKFFNKFDLELNEFPVSYKKTVIDELFEKMETETKIYKLRDYIKFIQNLNIREMYLFMNILERKLNRNPIKEKFLQELFNPNYFMSNQSNLDSQLQIIRLFNTTRFEKRLTDPYVNIACKIINSNIDYIFKIRDKLPRDMQSNPKYSFSFFNTYLRMLDVNYRDKYVYRIRRDAPADHSILLPDPGENKVKILFQNVAEYFMRYSGDISKYHINEVRIENCELSDKWNDTRFIYNPAQVQDKFSLYILKSNFQQTPNFKFLSYCKTLELIDVRNKTIFIDNYFRYLYTLYLINNYNLDHVQIQNIYVKSIKIMDNRNQNISFYIRASQLQYLGFVNTNINNLRISNSFNIQVLEIDNTILNITKLQELLNRTKFPKLNKITFTNLNSISNKTAIKIPNNLTDIIIRHVDFTVSFEDSNLNKLEHILLENTKIIIPKKELLSSVSQEKLEFLYLNIRNEKPQELEDKLRELDSDVFVRTPGLNDNEKFFS